MEAAVSITAFTAFARQATYTPSVGDALTVRVIVDRAVERWGVGSGGASIIERVDEVDFLASEVNPKKGDTLTQGGESWEIGNVVSNDGIIVRVTLRKINV